MRYSHSFSRVRDTAMAFGLILGCIAFSACDLFSMLPIVNPPSNTGSSFATAKLVSYGANDVSEFSGTIGSQVADVYDLGPMAVGDRIRVTVDAASGSLLDPTIAIFDQDKELWSINDDVDFDANNFNSAIDDVVTVAGDQFYLAITKYFQSTRGGSYNVRVQITRGGVVTLPAVQTLLLNFAGGPVTIAGDGSYNLKVFDAADIDDAYAGETAAIKQIIIDTVKDNFAATGLEIVTSDENPMLTPGTFSAIHFGAYSGTKFGIADDVDVGNRDRCDDGIVFIERFDDPFAQRPTVTGIGIAIGNVAAHEAGHLLGLNHVSDVTALMDNTGSASTLLEDQNFKTAPLSRSIFPFGDQNDLKLLERVVPMP
ncbi:MAG: matrixin family metalloprotease [Phycisphaerae bacterium]|nr:matrixin family metalloprotease [Phycisphaerae bacterium]